MKGLIIILIVSSLLGCKAGQVTQGDSLIISMKKTPCMGTCPDFDINIYKNGFVELDARQNLDLNGKFTSNVSTESLNELIGKFEENNFGSFQDSYTSNKTDLPTTFITYQKEGFKKKIEDYDGAPTALKDLEKAVAALIAELKWKAVK
ncbi:MAG: hypothetical protein ACJA2S_005151 [Cyclobacteriaceae bacterium]|jgi:hypothetical protein